jgi:hypothetical protein
LDNEEEVELLCGLRLKIKDSLSAVFEMSEVVFHKSLDFSALADMLVAFGNLLERRVMAG